ncbi:MAG: hypothetical protein ACRD2G_15690, partial [Terriglobia bacterium]
TAELSPELSDGFMLHSVPPSLAYPMRAVTRNGACGGAGLFNESPLQGDSLSSKKKKGGNRFPPFQDT